MTLAELAEAAGVHMSTASRALDPRRRDLVRESTARRVRAAADELGYRPDLVARSLSRGQTRTVAVVVPNLDNSIVPPLARAISRALDASHYLPLIAETQEDSERLQQVVEQFLERRVDAVIVMAAKDGDAEMLSALAEQVHVVLALRAPAGCSVPAAICDDLLGGRLAAEHLANLGHRRVALLAGPRDIPSLAGRAAGFLEATAKLGVEVVRAANAKWASYEEGKALQSSLLRSGMRATAVFAVTDLMAIGAIGAIHDHELRVPEDLSVVGFNDQPLSQHMSPALTTVRIPLDALGKLAAEAALELMNDRPVSTPMLVLPSLVVRSSTAAPSR